MAAETIDLTTDKDLTRTTAPVAIRRIDAVVDLAEVFIESDGTFEAGDVFQVLTLPANSMLWGGGIEIIDVVVGASAATFDLDTAAGDDLTDGVDGTAAGYGAAGTNGVLGFTNAVRVATADTLDLTLKTLTGTLTGGKVRVYAFVSDIDGVE